MNSPVSTSVPVRFTVPAGETAGAAMRPLDLPNKGPQAIVAVKDSEGQLRDLAWTAKVDTEVTAIASDTEEGRGVIRHSTAHVLAQAVQREFPGTRLGIGPAIENGFYYDFDTDEPFTPDDLKKI